MNKIIRVISAGDIKLFYIVNDGFKCSLLDRIIPMITGLGGAFFTITISLILALLGKGPLKIAGWQCLATLATSHILVHYLKKVFTRPRPFLNLSDIHTFNTRLYDYSFPSGHTTAAFSIGLTLSILFPMIAPVFITLAVLIGMSRVYLGVHYPTDVFVGMMIGTFFSVINHITMNQWLYSILNK
ncbi:undecaprenyl-diphosphatase [Anaerosolibacter carboniphilus]|uniref:Undecaprenyl-diphosphatase n=1 Tax=Anaerosolibacter carboniphilus TaxID=1417629 RepID=A0A841L0N5_9FIRM|nr:undecaprenyl-diphosphatase [Anaerosolibacter carboniphilus]